MPNALFRKTILAATQNQRIAKFVRRNGMRMGAARFVAGESLDECTNVLRRLNDNGLVTNTTLLGEAVNDHASVAAVVAHYQGILDRIATEKLQTNVALKLSHLGLDISDDVAFANLELLVVHAAKHGNFIRVDMEESFRVDQTLRFYRRLREAGHTNVGVVLQAYLYRSAEDLEALASLKPNLRLVKGAYLEPPKVAYPQKTEVDSNYIRLAEHSLVGGGYTAIATHDERIIQHVIDFTAKHNIPRTCFEFQMLYGVRSGYQLDLVRRGYRVLVATPFGPEWYFYLMRRLAERPANLLFILRNLLRS